MKLEREMNKMKSNVTKLFFLLLISHLAIAKSYFPRSNEAVYLETTAPGIVMIRATGIGVDNEHWRPKNSTLDKSANLDARRAAVWYVMLGGSDPLITSEESKALLKEYQKYFFKKKNITKFITWEAKYYDSRIRMDEKLKITKALKVNRRILKEELVKRNIVTSKNEIVNQLGRPTIMVLPEKQGETAPIELLKTNSNLKKGAEVIESYLSADGYDVVIPEQQQTLQQMAAAQFSVSGHEEDFSYMLALSVGSDVYITYTIDLSRRQLGSTTVKKASVGCRAYETTTGRLLGSETGYSPSRNTSEAVLIEEAMKDAIDKVLLRVLNYWENDIENGIQYKVIVKVSSDFGLTDAEDILFSATDLIDQMVKDKKENIFADYTLDLNIWCDPKQYQSSTDIYRALRKKYDGKGRLRREMITRKLILLQVNYE